MLRGINIINEKKENRWIPEEEEFHSLSLEQNNERRIISCKIIQYIIKMNEAIKWNGWMKEKERKR